MHALARRMAAALGIERTIALHVARSTMECLWHWAAKHAQDGNLSAHEPEAMADCIDWPGEPQALLDALVGARFVDPTDAGLVIHGWPEHCEDAVHGALYRAVRLFADGSVPEPRKVGREERAALEPRWLALLGVNPAESGAPESAAGCQNPPPAALASASASSSDSLRSSEEESSEPQRAAHAAPDGRRRRTLTAAPDELDSEQATALDVWCAKEHPEQRARLPALVVACLDFHRAKGNRHADWLATCRTWVRNESEGRFGRPRAPNREDAARAAADVTSQAAELIRRNREARERERAGQRVLPPDVRQLRAAGDP